MVIEIENRKYKLVKGGDCSWCAFLSGRVCSLSIKPNGITEDVVDACDSERSHWEEVEDEG